MSTTLDAQVVVVVLRMLVTAIDTKCLRVALSMWTDLSEVATLPNTCLRVGSYQRHQL